jgi:hypothetical protein
MEWGRCTVTGRYRRSRFTGSRERVIVSEPEQGLIAAGRYILEAAKIVKENNW